MWPAYVINLADNTARLAAVSGVLGGQGVAFRRIDAVNGWKLGPAEIAAAYDAARNARDGRQPLVPAEIGCYLSHIAAWEQIAAGDAPGGFVFEDDFDATSDLARVMTALSTDATGDWDMVKLFTLDPAVPLGAARDLAPGVRIGIPYRVPTCLIGYGLTRAAAARLAARARPFFRPVDEDQKFVWETGLRVALVLPPPVVLGDQQTVTGTIGRARRDGRRGGLGQALHRLLYGLRYRRALARHRRAEGWQA
ncbi:glycosyltransferase family 25 protein [Rhodobacter sp. Har01]|uniref:glycosyltransferase family 25 protein n=1 Tax=Rhodobacter sp. Har01 TaxID=2883999 RepID=UPI001D08311D|nr:glycosyltransferase family 25 protein [Rhodobacter sp. Har01]MCB6178830.1 glycosyltransferase family 25 protein [Rhodobacter sp. Har01]